MKNKILPILLFLSLFLLAYGVNAESCENPGEKESEICRRNLAKETLDMEYCNHAWGDRCYSELIDTDAALTEDNCNKITYQFMKDKCFRRLANKMNNPLICFNNKDFERTECLNQFSEIVSIVGTMIHIVIIAVLIFLYLWLKGFFRNIENKTIIKRILRGFVYAIPGGILYVLSSYFGFYSYWIGGVRGEEGMGIGILMLFLIPIIFIITIVLFVRGIIWKE